MTKLDLVGQRFGRLVVERPGGIKKGQGSFWWCRCDCGTVKRVHGGNLRTGHTQSCGCLAQETRKTQRGPLKHGHARPGAEHPLYRRWRSMVQRCTDPKAANYHKYGGRGIRVCDRWRDFAAFLADMGMPPTPKHQLDRIDPVGHYEPGKVRWATLKEQRANRRQS